MAIVIPGFGQEGDVLSSRETERRRTRQLLPRPDADEQGEILTSEYSPGEVRTRGNQVNVASQEAQRNAAENLVSSPNRGELRDSDFDFQALASAGVGGLTEGAVKQRNEYFSQVTDTFGSGETVPNLGDQRTKEAFDRYFGGRTQFGNRKTSKPSGGSGASFGVSNPGFQDKDPTRVAFQNQFFPSETLKDVGGNNRRAPGRFRIT